MTRVFAATAGVLLFMSASLAAHRLDEYLQAARVSLERDRITLEVDLTPGANIAAPINALLDRDGDNTISPAEAEAYARVVLADLVLTLDDRPVGLTLTRVEVPSIDEMRHGLGTIQVRPLEMSRSPRAGVICTSGTITILSRASTWAMHSCQRKMTSML